MTSGRQDAVLLTAPVSYYSKLQPLPLQPHSKTGMWQNELRTFTNDCSVPFTFNQFEPFPVVCSKVLMQCTAKTDAKTSINILNFSGDLKRFQSGQL